jgi:hypothetical protein
MTEYDRTNTGTLFKNERKESERHPDMNGKINIAGVDHWLNAWTKVGKNGKFLSLSIGKPVEDRAAAKPAVPFKDDDLSDVPW